MSEDSKVEYEITTEPRTDGDGRWKVRAVRIEPDHRVQVYSEPWTYVRWWGVLAAYNAIARDKRNRRREARGGNTWKVKG